MLQEHAYQLLFADDLKWTAGGSCRYLTIWCFIFLWLAVGTPFSWHKFRGGISLDYVGFYCDYARFAVGISERRSAWFKERSMDSRPEGVCGISWAAVVCRAGVGLASTFLGAALCLVCCAVSRDDSCSAYTGEAHPGVYSEDAGEGGTILCRAPLLHDLPLRRSGRMPNVQQALLCWEAGHWAMGQILALPNGSVWNYLPPWWLGFSGRTTSRR